MVEEKKHRKKRRIKGYEDGRKRKLPSPPEIRCLAEGTISTTWYVTQNTIK
jgi:hypothetical protein